MQKNRPRLEYILYERYSGLQGEKKCKKENATSVLRDLLWLSLAPLAVYSYWLVLPCLALCAFLLISEYGRSPIMDISKLTPVTNGSYYGQSGCRVCNSITMHRFEFLKGMYLKKCLEHRDSHILPVCFEVKR